jgi:lysine-N-methylase
MKLYAPKYYKTFQCLADRCEHSCCIGWEIDVDEETVQKYQALKEPYGSVIMDRISMEETPHFRLDKGDRCPHLDERGLCKIILNVGEDYLCDICREHPRFYNYTDVAEVGLGLSCPEAARIVLSASDYDVSEEIGVVCANEETMDFNGRTQRERVYAILQNREKNYAERLDEIYRSYALEAGKDSRWLSLLDSLEYLNEDHKHLFMKYSSDYRPTWGEEYLERFLAYLVFRHATEAVDEEDFSRRLSFCLFCESLLSSLICTEAAYSLEEISALAGIVSEEIEYSEDNTEMLTYETEDTFS